MFHFLKPKNKKNPAQIQLLATGFTLQANIPRKVVDTFQKRRKNLISRR